MKSMWRSGGAGSRTKKKNRCTALYSKGKLLFSSLPTTKKSWEDMDRFDCVTRWDSWTCVLFHWTYSSSIMYNESRSNADCTHRKLDTHTKKKVSRVFAGRFRRDHYRLTSRVSASSFIDSWAESISETIKRSTVTIVSLSLSLFFFCHSFISFHFLSFPRPSIAHPYSARLTV